MIGKGRGALAYNAYVINNELPHTINILRADAENELRRES